MHRISVIQSRQRTSIPVTPRATPTSKNSIMLRTRDFCKKVSEGIQTELLRLEVRREKLYFMHALPERTKWVLDTPSITLASLIDHKCIKESEELRLLICTAVARAAWQFYGSGWWESDCTKENFCFVWVASGTNSSPQLHIDKPFFYYSMDERDNYELTAGSTHNNPMILALGIILLEVELGVRIENARDKKELSIDGTVTPNTDLFVAQRLLEEDVKWAGHEDVRPIIHNCVTGNTFKSASYVEEVRQALLRDVVEPLEALLSEKVGNRGVEGYCIPDACGAFGSFIATKESNISSSKKTEKEPEVLDMLSQQNRVSPMKPDWSAKDEK
jgi:hypothetical protein